MSYVEVNKEHFALHHRGTKYFMKDRCKEGRCHVNVGLKITSLVFEVYYWLYQGPS